MYLYHYNKKIFIIKKNYKLINQKKKITSSFRYFQNLKSQQTLKNKKQTKIKITKEKQNNDFPKQIGENVENYLCMKKKMK